MSAIKPYYMQRQTYWTINKLNKKDEKNIFPGQQCCSRRLCIFIRWKCSCVWNCFPFIPSSINKKIPLHNILKIKTLISNKLLMFYYQILTLILIKWAREIHRFVAWFTKIYFSSLSFSNSFRNILCNVC